MCVADIILVASHIAHTSYCTSLSLVSPRFPQPAFFVIGPPHSPHAWPSHLTDVPFPAHARTDVALLSWRSVRTKRVGEISRGVGVLRCASTLVDIRSVHYRPAVRYRQLKTHIRSRHANTNNNSIKLRTRTWPPSSSRKQSRTCSPQTRSRSSSSAHSSRSASSH